MYYFENFEIFSEFLREEYFDKEQILINISKKLFWKFFAKIFTKNSEKLGFDHDTMLEIFGSKRSITLKFLTKI